MSHSKNQYLLLLIFLALALVLTGCMHSQGQVNQCTYTQRGIVYFGMSIGSSDEVTEAQWEAFLRSNISKEMEQGFTVIDSKGAWKGDEGLEFESSKMLVVLSNQASLKNALAKIADQYRILFDQNSVLVEVQKTCADLLNGI